MVHHEDSIREPSWSISSSSGRGVIECVRVSGTGDAATIICAIRVAGLSWQRSRKISEAPLVEDFEIHLPQVVLSLDALFDLRQKLIQWQISPGEFICELGSKLSGDQVIIMEVANDAGLIYSAGKTACIFSYNCGPSMNARCAFVIDQSCIQLLSDSLGNFLAAAET